MNKFKRLIGFIFFITLVLLCSCSENTGVSQSEKIEINRIIDSFEGDIYFTGTVCNVSLYLADDDYVTLKVVNGDKKEIVVPIYKPDQYYITSDGLIFRYPKIYWFPERDSNNSTIFIPNVYAVNSDEEMYEAWLYDVLSGELFYDEQFSHFGDVDVFCESNRDGTAFLDVPEFGVSASFTPSFKGMEYLENAMWGNYHMNADKKGQSPATLTEMSYKVDGEKIITLRSFYTGIINWIPLYLETVYMIDGGRLTPISYKLSGDVLAAEFPTFQGEKEKRFPDTPFYISDYLEAGIYNNGAAVYISDDYWLTLRVEFEDGRWLDVPIQDGYKDYLVNGKVHGKYPSIYWLAGQSGDNSGIILIEVAHSGAGGVSYETWLYDINENKLTPDDTVTLSRNTSFYTTNNGDGTVLVEMPDYGLEAVVTPTGEGMRYLEYLWENTGTDKKCQTGDFAYLSRYSVGNGRITAIYSFFSASNWITLELEIMYEIIEGKLTGISYKFL